MQQNQRISTGPPGGTVAGPVEAGGADATGGVDGVLTDAGGLEAVEPPQAVAIRANAAIRTPGRNGRAGMSFLLCDVAGQPVDAVVVGVVVVVAFVGLESRDRWLERWRAGAAAPASAVAGSASQLARTTTRST
jgi:hypothetical protein